MFIFIIIIIIIIIFVSNFMQGTYNYITETKVFLWHIMLELSSIYKFCYIEGGAGQPDSFRNERTQWGYNFLCESCYHWNTQYMPL
jgi:hypothetical protein